GGAHPGRRTPRYPPHRRGRGPGPAGHRDGARDQYRRRHLRDRPAGRAARPGRGMTGHGAAHREPLLRVDVVTVFPHYLAPLRLALLVRARDRGPRGTEMVREINSDAGTSVIGPPEGLLDLGEA